MQDAGPRRETTGARTGARRGLYKRGGTVEREFGRLKGEWALAPLRVRRIQRVQLHADLTVLSEASVTCAWTPPSSTKEASARVYPRLLLLVHLDGLASAELAWATARHILPSCQVMI